jgi:archaellum component FlaF (FlaF/FlaG flagellin family)
MPQFDFFSFSSQAFWILIGLFVFYFFIKYTYISKYAQLFKFRIKLYNLVSRHKNLNVSNKKKLYDVYIKKFFELNK